MPISSTVPVENRSRWTRWLANAASIDLARRMPASPCTVMDAHQAVAPVHRAPGCCMDVIMYNFDIQ